MKHHLIIGFGKWSKRIISFLQKKKIFSKIYIKTRDHFFESGSKKKINYKDFSKIQKKINSIHICTPVKSHFFYIKKYSKIKKIIVEKPFLQNLTQLQKVQNKLFQKNYLLVNYTDLFNPILLKLKNEIKDKSYKKMVLNYSKQNQLYKNKYDCSKDWLDHPLSIIFYLFRKFPEFKIIKNKSIKKKGFCEKLHINYNYSNWKVEIKLNLSKKNQRNILLNGKSKKTIYDLKKNLVLYKKNNIFKSKKTSFDMLYFYLKNKTALPYQNFKFHKNIMKEKNRILKKITNYS
tara:strand:+ start:754 stop:1623 length:870 start_codon:yes stop_codon:yes gene_type:complete